MTQIWGRARVAVAALAMSMLTAYAVADVSSDKLASPESFSGIADTAARSAAIFTELGKVLTNPRCTNCHPAGDRPHQGENNRLHQPPVERGADGHGQPSMRCSICHQAANFDPGRVPGHPEWHLAPREMAWEGKTVADICTQIKDPAQWRPSGRGADRPYRQGHAGGVGLGARLWPRPRAGHASAGRRAGRGVGQERSDVSGELALLWQIYSRSCFLPICLLQYGHR
jgi:hypothetical protein